MAFPNNAIAASLQPNNDGSDLWAFAELFLNNWETGVLISRAYSTSITSARSAAEQRYSLLDSPLMAIEAKILAGKAPREVASLMASAQRMTKARGLWPLFTDPIKVSVAASETETAIVFEDLSLTRISVGSFLVFVTQNTESNYHPYDSGLFVTEILDIDGNEITVTALTQNIPENSVAFPLIQSRLSLSVNGTVLTDALLELNLTVSEEPGPLQTKALIGANAIPAGMQTGLGGLPIFDPTIDAEESWSWGFVRRGEAASSGNSSETETYGTRGLFTSSFSLKSKTRTEAFQTIGFFDSRRGKAFPFWFPSKITDIYGWTGVTSGTTLMFRSGGIKADADLKPYLYIKKKTGDFLVCDVVSYSLVEEDLFSVVFEDIGESPTGEEIERVGVCYLSRFDSDTLKETWLTTEHCETSFSIVELEDEKALTIQHIDETETSNLLTQWTAGSCFAEEEPIPEGVYVGPVYSNPLFPELWRYVPESGIWTDLSADFMGAIDQIGYTPWIRAYYLSNLDTKAIYLCGNVKRVGKIGGVPEVLRYASAGIQLVGKNNYILSENPYDPERPGVPACLHVHNGSIFTAVAYSISEVSFDAIIHIFRLNEEGYWEVFAITDEVDGAPQNFRTIDGQLYLCLFNSGGGGLLALSDEGVISDLGFSFGILDITSFYDHTEIWMVGAIQNGGGNTYQGGVARIDGEGLYSLRGGGFFNNADPTDATVRPLVGHFSGGYPCGPGLSYNGAYYICSKTADIFYSTDTSLVSYLQAPVDDLLPDATGNAFLGTFSGGRNWKQAQVFPSDNNESSYALDLCVYKGRVFVVGRFFKLRTSGASNVEHFAVNEDAASDHDADWVAVANGPEGRDHYGFICAYTHDRNESINTHDKGHFP